MGRFLLPHTDQQEDGHAECARTINRFRPGVLDAHDRNDGRRVPVRPRRAMADRGRSVLDGAQPDNR